MRTGSAATSTRRIVISGWSLGATGSDELPCSARVDASEVYVGVDATDDGAQQHQN